MGLTDDLVERVALAISGGDDTTSILEIHRSRARLAIEAMREPTRAMIESGRLTLLAAQGMTEATLEGDAKWVWIEMIDTALQRESE